MIRKETLANQVYQVLKEDILKQVIPGGSKMTLKMLQDRFELSTTPLREAMNRLTQEGLLIHQTNVGAHVIHLTPDDAVELYEMSAILEAAAMHLAYTRDPQGLREALSHSVTLQEAALFSQDINRFQEASDDFHDILFKLADNRRLYESSKRIRNQISILTNAYQSDLSASKRLYEAHKAIAEAIIKGEPEKAAQLHQAHLMSGQKFIVEQLK